MPGILDYLRETLGARVTSAKRDPNSALGLKNPRSYHNIGQAVDVAPIPGMNFQQYVQKLKDAGYDIIEARDEVTNPSKNATGPHWHVAYGQGRAKGPIQINPDQQRFVKTAQVRPIQLSPEQMQQRASSFNVDLDMQPPYTTPPIHNPAEPTGLAGIIAGAQPNYGAMSQVIPGERDPLAPKKKKKPFGKDGVGSIIVGSIADALAQHWGAQPGYAPAVDERHKAKQERNLAMEKWQRELAQKAQARRESFEDFVQRQKYQQANPDPTSAARMAVEAGYTPGTPEFRDAVRSYMFKPVVIEGQQYVQDVPPPTSAGSAPQSRIMSNGQRAWFINGKWYDNPEGH